MHSKLAAGLAIAAALFSAPSFAADPTVYNTISGPELQKLMTSWGFRAELTKDSVNEPMIKSSSQGVDYIVNFYDCTKSEPMQCNSLTLVAGFSYDKPFSVTTINEWNRDGRFSRAYIDKDDDPIMEMDVQIKGGITAGGLKANFENWDDQLKGFTKAINWK